MAKQKLIIEIFGVPETQAWLKKQNKEILTEVDKTMGQACLFLKDEIRSSIMGQRGELRSFKTGAFMRSVEMKKDGIMEYQIFTDCEYSPWLEYGTSSIAPRRHFGNSVARNKIKVQEFVQTKIDEIISRNASK